MNADVSPPPISGGTLLLTRDGGTLVAADPDRDAIYLVDVANATLLHSVALRAGDEPGRAVEDASGRVHVALRGGHAVATLELAAPEKLVRRDVCDLPRGLAYDEEQDQVHVACAEGSLVSMGAEPSAPVTRVRELGRDLCDVILDRGELAVTRFRSADLIRLDAEGEIADSVAPPTLSREEQSVVKVEAIDTEPGSCVAAVLDDEALLVRHQARSTPSVAWRTLALPDGGAVMLHQRARSAPVQVQSGGYGQSSGCGPGIVQTAVTLMMPDGDQRTKDLVSVALAVDVAISPAGDTLAVAAPGMWQSGAQVLLYPLAGFEPPTAAKSGKSTAPVGVVPQALVADVAFKPDPNCLTPMFPMTKIDGQVSAVTFVADSRLAVQLREPAAIWFVDMDGAVTQTVALADFNRVDTGHRIFHTATSSGIACASCHPEAGDDAHVWNFDTIGPRRTQSLRGGILGSEPLHWNGDMADFGMLMHDVFAARMGGFAPQYDQVQAVAHWIDAQPALRATARDADAVARGRALFESEAVGCAKCHSGPLLTNNQTVDVGTGAALQVPALRGVSFRTPLMHDGCAKQLSDRFGPCGGGELHGHTAQLSSDELSELTAYLETL